MVQPISLRSSKPTDDSKQGYSGCAACGKVGPCATQVPFAVKYAGKILSVMDYFCEDCAKLADQL